MRYSNAKTTGALWFNASHCCPMENRAATPISPLYLLERSDVGIVQLNAQREVVGMNGFARRILPVDEKQPFDRMVLSFHPERSQPKVEFMLDQAAQCPVSAPPPMTMIINIPERVLLIKVSHMSDGQGQPTGYTLVFHDITELVAGEDAGSARTAVPDTAKALPGKTPGGKPEATSHPRRLLKVPTVSGQRIVLVDATEILSIRSEGHYTRVCTADASRFCNLGISDLEARLDPADFMRVHRSHIVNLQAVDQLLREDGRLQLRLRGTHEPVPVSRSSATAVLERLGVPVGQRQG